MCDHHDHDHEEKGVDRRSFLKTGVAGPAAAAVVATVTAPGSTASAHHDPNAYAPPPQGALPYTGLFPHPPPPALSLPRPCAPLPSLQCLP